MRSIVSVLIFAMLGIPFGVFAADDDVLVMGVFPRRNYTETIRMYTPLASYLSDQLGREVRLETTRDFPTFWEGVKEQRYDLVHYNQYHYVKSHKEFGYRVILKNEEFGSSEIAGAVVARTDSGIDSLKDLRNGTIVFGGGRRAMMAYVVVTYLLREAGLEEGDYTEEFAINPPNACMATYFGQGDAGGVGDIVIDLPIVRDKIDVGELHFLAVSERIAHLPWAVRGDMDTGLQRQIQLALLSLNCSPKGRAILKGAKLTGLIHATDEEYDVHRKIIREVTGEAY